MGQLGVGLGGPDGADADAELLQGQAALAARALQQLGHSFPIAVVDGRRHRKSHGADPTTVPHPGLQPSPGTIRPMQDHKRSRVGAIVAVVAAVVSIAGGLAAPLYAVFGGN
ncbi:hypothetical protein Acy02nite_75550 [Actinoplanes cyaneus]|uniref:Uncharacterized protein n=1 Tax=Actinoplanes cyaneus TaxID=52696 RepID=A0A919IPC2_9ACTN|nr:hypothetical protein Acy02nite_75550 [Actinoplanes cyaneus]